MFISRGRWRWWSPSVFMAVFLMILMVSKTNAEIVRNHVVDSVVYINLRDVLASVESSNVIYSEVVRANIPFTALSAKWRGNKPNDSVYLIEFRTSSDQLVWSEWTTPEVESVNGEDFFTDLVFIKGEERTHTYVNFRLALLPSSSGEFPTIEDVSFTFYDPDVTPQNILDSTEGGGRVQRNGDPYVVPRSGWGADESISTWSPSYNSSITHVVIHHTAGNNNTNDAPAAIRTIHRYHAVTRGWGDIGYNYLIDPRGVIYEGRKGGYGVIGAHASAFNSYTIGISLLGNFEEVEPTSEAVSSLQKLISWISKKSSIDPLARRYLNGRDLNTIIGHRDIGSTACPGNILYSKIPAIRNGVAAASGAASSAFGKVPVLHAPASYSEGNGVNTQFVWYNNNQPDIIKTVEFTLREASGKDGDVGRYVGQCGSNGKGISIGVTENVPSSFCGEQLKHNQWYKWAVGLQFNNGFEDRGFSSWFKTQGTPTVTPSPASPSNSSSDVPLSNGSILLQWNNNNDNRLIESVEFTLREATSHNGIVGEYVGKCGDSGSGISIGITNSYDSSLCGSKLKPNQWYKWAVHLNFKDGSQPKGFSSWFRTSDYSTSAGQFFWTGNGSVISYYGRKPEGQSQLKLDGEYPYGVNQDTTLLHSGNPVGFFQWQVSGLCKRLKISAEGSNSSQKPTITIRNWSGVNDGIAFENVTLPFVIGESNTGFSFVDNSSSQWYVVAVAFDGVSQQSRLNAECSSDTPSFHSPKQAKPVLLEGGYKWNGNASIISRIYGRLEVGNLPENSGEWPYGAFEDVTYVRPSPEKPTVFFQWMSGGPSCNSLELSSEAPYGTEVELRTKAWSSPTTQNFVVTLPHTITASQTWTVIQVAFKNPVDKAYRVWAKCK